ncbi:hypothetical protein NADFUDRAFT_49302 [Nadsonia fulvescens var. elongata DSM 6958]|uniref:Vps72/YL1 C-terminal domain-containing protein n=1 Tax=Nadsonia fulvescens var. elongata DSM 6958 TaxID=857566 RepID=A0A1E3PTB9_9ASCO|nr:hypothetical protein NADFUDRAFT_49302 [Nadsonia fulvescens var. elongata DSM 6958]
MSLVNADLSRINKCFKSPSWKPSAASRRNKNAKALLAEEQKVLAERQQQNGSSNKNFMDAANYFNLEAPPSLVPRKWYCDITGLEGKYRSVGSGLRYHDKEVYAVIKTLAPGVDQQYLELRHANVILR